MWWNGGVSWVAKGKSSRSVVSSVSWSGRWSLGIFCPRYRRDVVDQKVPLCTSIQ